MLDIISLRHTSEICDLGDGVKVQWLHSGKILLFDTGGNARNTVERWFLTLEGLFQQWDEHEPLYLLHDFTLGGLTPYGRKRGTDAANLERKHRKTVTAIVLPKGILAQAVRLFAQAELRLRDNKNIREVFTSREAAINWLVTHIQHEERIQS